MVVLPRPASERPPPPQKGKKVASSTEGETTIGATDKDAARDDGPSSPLGRVNEEPAMGGRGSPLTLACSKEVVMLADPKDGSSALTRVTPVFCQPRGESEPPAQLKVPLAMPVAKRQRLAEPDRYVLAGLEVLVK